MLCVCKCEKWGRNYPWCLLPDTRRLSRHQININGGFMCHLTIATQTYWKEHNWILKWESENSYNLFLTIADFSWCLCFTLEIVCWFENFLLAIVRMVIILFVGDFGTTSAWVRTLRMSWRHSCKCLIRNN